MAKDKPRDWSGWIRTGLQFGVIVVAALLAWGVLKADVRMNTYRVDVNERQIQELRRTNAILVGDVREIKTILTRMENGKGKP